MHFSWPGLWCQNCASCFGCSRKNYTRKSPSRQSKRIFPINMDSVWFYPIIIDYYWCLQLIHSMISISEFLSWVKLLLFSCGFHAILCKNSLLWIPWLGVEGLTMLYSIMRYNGPLYNGGRLCKKQYANIEQYTLIHPCLIVVIVPILGQGWIHVNDQLDKVTVLVISYFFNILL